MININETFLKSLIHKQMNNDITFKEMIDNINFEVNKPSENDISEKIKLILFARWIVISYSSDPFLDNCVLNANCKNLNINENIPKFNSNIVEWYKNKIEYFENVVYKNYINSGLVDNLEKYFKS